MPDFPKPKSEWLHKSGSHYVVIAIANTKATKADYPLTVVYQDDAGDIWSHPLAHWHERMTEIKK